MICELLLSSQEPKALIPLYNYDFNVSMQAKSKNLVAHVSKYNKHKIEFMFLFVIDFTTVFSQTSTFKKLLFSCRESKIQFALQKRKNPLFCMRFGF